MARKSPVRTTYHPETPKITPEEWAKTWGEVVTVTKAGEILGVSRWTVRQWINNGWIDETPNGKVLVRSAAAWANSNTRVRNRILRAIP